MLEIIYHKVRLMIQEHALSLVPWAPFEGVCPPIGEAWIY